MVLALAVVMGLAFGAIGLGLYLFALPLPLCVLWLAAGVVRSDELADER